MNLTFNLKWSWAQWTCSPVSKKLIYIFTSKKIFMSICCVCCYKPLIFGDFILCSVIATTVDEHYRCVIFEVLTHLWWPAPQCSQRSSASPNLSYLSGGVWLGIEALLILIHEFRTLRGFKTGGKSQRGPRCRCSRLRVSGHIINFNSNKLKWFFTSLSYPEWNKINFLIMSHKFLICLSLPNASQLC